MFLESFLPTYVILSTIISGLWFNLPACKLEQNTLDLKINEDNETSFKRENKTCNNDKCNELWMEKLTLLYNNWSSWSKCYMKMDGMWIRLRERSCNNHAICKNTTIQEEKFCKQGSKKNRIEKYKWKHKQIAYREGNHTIFVAAMVYATECAVCFKPAIINPCLYCVLNPTDIFMERLGTNPLQRTYRSGLGKSENKRIYSKWSRWTICSKSCFTQRYRWCKKVEICGNEVIRQSAYCYTEGSHCQTLILNKIKGRPVIEDNQVNTNDGNYYLSMPTKAPVNNQLPGNDKGSPVALEANKVTVAVCGVTFNNTTNSYRPHYSNMLRIIGGRPTQSGKWPWIVAVLNRFKEAFCGGTLVAKEWVLTAAHCVRKRLYVSIGEYNLSLHEGTELLMKVKRTITHPKYNSETVDNDVALLKLPKPVPNGVHSGIACLPRPRQHLPIKRLCTIVGWGKRSTTDAYGTDILHEAQVPIVSTQSCRVVYEDYYITGNMFCAGYRRGRMDSCSGDSGGPLLCQDKLGKWTVFGITSFGEGCGKKGKYGIYTKLPNYVRWVRSVIQS